ncbi:hypothetical protein AnigIFM50267_007596 [Aspergillus niger]|nr:hypothetical protein AnigIFM50267_007596 [Aspergillus niger]
MEKVHGVWEDNDARAILRLGPEASGYKCQEPGCEGRLKLKENLKRRLETHTKEKHHACWVPGCHCSFSRSHNLNAHYTKTHSKGSGRNRYVATLDETSPDYNPEYRGQVTPDGGPISGSRLEYSNPDYGDLSVEGHLSSAESEHMR